MCPHAIGFLFLNHHRPVNPPPQALSKVFQRNKRVKTAQKGLNLLLWTRLTCPIKSPRKVPAPKKQNRPIRLLPPNISHLIRRKFCVTEQIQTPITPTKPWLNFLEAAMQRLLTLTWSIRSNSQRSKTHCHWLTNWFLSGDNMEAASTSTSAGRQETPKHRGPFGMSRLVSLSWANLEWLVIMSKLRQSFWPLNVSWSSFCQSVWLGTKL